jgi:hypothetical protein
MFNQNKVCPASHGGAVKGTHFELDLHPVRYNFSLDEPDDLAANDG